MLCVSSLMVYGLLVVLLRYFKGGGALTLLSHRRQFCKYAR